jgi:creatinine amidohydrolase
MPLMEEMTWPEIDKAAKQGKTLIFILGSVEQHGPHLPVGTDMYIPREIMLRVAERVDAVVAPVAPYGFKSKPQSGGGEGFQGTFSLNGITVINVVRDLLGAFIRKGFVKVFILNWHYENVEFVHEGLSLAMEDCGGLAKIVVLDNPNALVDQRILDTLFAGDVPGWGREHAAIFETSMMLALKPELVREDLIADDEAEENLPYAVYPTPEKVITKSGVLWHASKASKNGGKRAAESMVEAIVTIIRKEFS